jgi:hypothetical protein
MLSSLDSAAREAAWDEVGSALRQFEESGQSFVGPCELVVGVGVK